MSKPVFGTKEWANESADNCRGCPHDCHYCYAKADAARWGRCAPGKWHKMKVYWGKIQKIEKMLPTKVMYPAHHDIHPDILDECMEAIARLLFAGHKLLIVSKPHPECIERICRDCEKYRNRILFRFTIGSGDDQILKLWEPDAPCIEDRITSLKMAYRNHYKTSVSAEPMLDNKPARLIGALGRYVSDAMWFGKPNYLRGRLILNHAPDEVKLEGDKLMKDLSDEFIRQFYCEYRTHDGIKWKESIKKIVGIDVPEQPGLDI